MASKTLVQTRVVPLIGLSFSLVLTASFLLPSPARAQLLEMTDLIAHPQHYDRKEVVVMGQVHEVRQVTDKQGHPAVQFLLKDPSGTLKVTTRVEVQEGDQVIVEGTFTRRRQGGRITIYNEVQANSVRPLNELHPDLVG
ncbi:MAG TPA: OB-fold nucleic acid binding domain-containing protein [Nitrospira sp.]|nr:OB-fold nucleic acid binding domain-containing protein [Nitrospira sp.]